MVDEKKKRDSEFKLTNLTDLLTDAEDSYGILERTLTLQPIYDDELLPNILWNDTDVLNSSNNVYEVESSDQRDGEVEANFSIRRTSLKALQSVLTNKKKVAFSEHTEHDYSRR